MEQGLRGSGWERSPEIDQDVWIVYQERSCDRVSVNCSEFRNALAELVHNCSDVLNRPFQPIHQI